MATLVELRKLARDRKLPNRSKLKTKAQYLSALGMSEDLKQHKLSSGKSKAIEAQSKHLSKGNATQRAIIKGRLTRAISRELKASGGDLSQEQKRQIAIKAIQKEVQAIKAGKPESKGRKKRGGIAADDPMWELKVRDLDPEVEKLSKKELRQAMKGSVGKIKVRDLERLAQQEQVGLGAIAELDDIQKGADAQKVASMTTAKARKRGLSTIDGGRAKEPSLKELFDQAQAIGAKYDDGTTSLDAHRKAKEFVNSTMGEVRAKAKGKKHLGVVEGGKKELKLEDVNTPEDRAKYAKQEATRQRSQGNEKAAKAWDEKAKEARKAAIDRDMKAQSNSQTSLFGVTEHRSDMPLFGGSQQSEPKKPEKAPKGVVEVSPHDLNFDPKRFQYKLVHGGETGASGSLDGVKKWDENLGGVLQVWRDPADGKDYVVNGHNRASKARQLGAETVSVRYLPVDTAKEARAIGALTNIAESKGNSLDAAKFFRDSGITREDLEAKGIPMKEKIATDGLALSKLAPHLFDKVVQGDIPIERATLIGDRIHDHEAQSKLVELIDKETKRGRKINNDVVRELADTVQSAPTHSEMQFSLFGAEESTRNLALEKAEVTAEVRKRLSREKKLFGVVSKSKAAKELEKAGNQIDTDKSREISEQAGQVLGVFDQLKNQSGPVSSAINRAVERIANGENKKVVTDDLHKQLVEQIPEALGLGKRSSTSGSKSSPGSATTGKKVRIKRSEARS